MKYFKNLIKRKKYGAIITSIVVSLMGIAIIYLNSVQVIIEGIKESDLPANVVINNGFIGLLGTTNLGLVLIGALMIYIGLIFTPKNAIGSQDDSDYIIESREDMIYIKYKDREFLVKKETFEPTDLFFKDKNKKFVSMATGYQVYNYVKSRHNDLTEKEIDDNKVISADEIYKKFSDVHMMTFEDKNRYLSYKKTKNKIRPFFVVLTIFFAFFTVDMVLGAISYLFFEEFTKENIIYVIIAIILVFISLLCTKKSYAASMKNKKTTKEIMNRNIYYVNCYSYDKKIDQSSDANGNVDVKYYIKVTDHNYILNQWLQVSKEIYTSNEVINVWLVVDETGKNTIEIVGLV